MRYVVNLVALLLALSVFGMSRNAQEVSPQKPAVPAVNQRQPIITKYLPDENKTVVMLRKMRFDGPYHGNCSPLLVAEFSYEGKKPQAPEAVLLGFIASHFQERELVVIAGEEKFRLGQLMPIRIHQWNECRNMYRSVGVLVEREKFLRIAQAGKLQVYVGDENLPFTDEHIEALREFARSLRL